MASRSMDSLYRSWLAAQVPQAQQSGAITGATPANTAIIEIPFVGREKLAVQVFGAFVGTFKVQGSLANPDQISVNGVTSFVVPGNNTEYVDIASITDNTLTQITTGLFSRIRIVCTAYTSGSPVVRVL